MDPTGTALLEVFGAIAGNGVLGACLVVVGIAYYRQGLALSAVQEARVADAQKVATTLLDLQEKWQGALGELVSAVERLNDRRRP